MNDLQADLDTAQLRNAAQSRAAAQQEWARGRKGLLLQTFAVLTMLAHVLDLISAVFMIREHGIRAELNPLARALFREAGASGLGLAKLAVVIVGVLMLLWLGRHGRPHVAMLSMLVAAALGLLGFVSNVA